MPTTPTYIVNDQPTDRDALDFTPYVETLADIIQTGNTPLTIGVFGTWGSGKTSLMRMVRKTLPKKFTTVWFDAWKYGKEESLWRALLLSVLSSLKETASKQGKPTEEFEKLQALLYRDMEVEKVGGVTIDLAKLGGSVATGLARLSLSFIPGLSTLTNLVEELQKGAAGDVDSATAAIRRERTKIYIEQIQFLEQFQEKFKGLVQEHVQPNRLVVFVDDLDRCMPEKAIEVLEAIKLFLDAENCIFVLGLDQEVIARGIEMKYKELGDHKDGDGQAKFTIEGVRYLEKIIQLPFQIPPVEQSDMGDFVHGLSADWPHEDCPKVFAEGLGDNPRQIKRTVNTFLMLWKLAQKREAKLQGKVKPLRLAKVVAIQTVYPDLHNLLLKEEPRYLKDLEEYYRSERSEPAEKKINPADLIDWVGNTSEHEKQPQPKENSIPRVEPPPAIVPFLSRRGASAVRRILTMHKPDMPDANFIGLPPDELKLYFTLTRRAETPQPTPPPEAARLVFEPQMVKIPAGEFLMGSTKEQAAQAIKDGLDENWAEWEQPQHTVELSEYSIGKYPITNREYQEFVKDAKYKPPQGWDGDKFPDGKGGHPVVNVSWEDATAYCKWLGEKTKKQYRLPTEAEWEKAARRLPPFSSGEGRGEDQSQVYPWGNKFDPKKANTIESGIGDTSEVGQFSPQGDSPFGCADMAGNIWEWCNDWFDEKEYKKRKDGVKDPKGPQQGNARVVRGGAFDYYVWYARCAFRFRYYLGYYYWNLGFRVAVVVLSPISLANSGS
ncbi:MAG: SUMF1/EgtB/PvdO family nonheme iron enzyme [Chloroflexota bacterium]